MSKKLYWLGVSCLLAAVVLSSCSSATSTTTSTTAMATTPTTAVTSTPTTAVTSTSATAIATSTATTTVSTTTASTGVTTNPGSLSVPTYGGTLTLFVNEGAYSPTGWDAMMTSALGDAAEWANPYMEWLLNGDIADYGLGPGATGAFAFDLYEATPVQYFGGVLATSWTINAGPPLTYTWNIRQGVYFTGNSNIGFASREMTAADVVYSEQRAMTRPGFAASFTWLSSTVATGPFTVVWTCSTFYANWAWRMGGTVLGTIWAPEVCNANPNNWQDQSGTGPFMLTDYVQGSSATYTRNPNYWGSITIQGKKYQEPFIQTLIYPIIPDGSTQIAALRTGKIDWDPLVPLTYQHNLASSDPTLKTTEYLSGNVDILKFNRLTSTIANSQAIRRALMTGTDLKTIADLEYSGGQYYSWPLAPGAEGFVPLNQLPTATQQLWNYNPTLAKQEISAAGYPNGFTIQLDVGPIQTEEDDANILASEWAQLGVKVVINLINATLLATEYGASSYKDALFYYFTCVNPFTSLNQARSDVAGAIYLPNDPLGMQAMYNQASANPDPISQNTELQTLNTTFQSDVGVIGFADANVLNCYWPWLENYYGEVNAEYYNQIPMILRMWINESIKQ